MRLDGGENGFRKLDDLKGGCLESFMVREGRQRGVCQRSHIRKGLLGRKEISGTVRIEGTS